MKLDSKNRVAYDYTPEVDGTTVDTSRKLCAERIVNCNSDDCLLLPKKNLLYGLENDFVSLERAGCYFEEMYVSINVDQKLVK